MPLNSSPPTLDVRISARLHLPVAVYAEEPETLGRARPNAGRRGLAGTGLFLQSGPFERAWGGIAGVQSTLATRLLDGTTVGGFRGRLVKPAREGAALA